MKKLIPLLLVALFSFNAYAGEKPKKEAPPPAVKPQVKKPCKPGQTEEKDNCHQVKKLK